ncbi:unnamed protein product [Symbiodinium sp. CCMP2592]|nr:unnamed protein product [Symbiodinium sp. CCMP2592]
MRCRHLPPPDMDVSVLVGKRTLHSLASRPASVLALLRTVDLVRFEAGKVHRRTLPLSHGHSFTLRVATRSSVAAAVLAPRCRRRFATWWEASDTDLFGGFSKHFERFRKPAAEARCSTSYEQLRHSNHRNSSTQGFADPGALLWGCKARWRQTPKHETLLQMQPCTSAFICDGRARKKPTGEELPLGLGLSCGLLVSLLPEEEVLARNRSLSIRDPLADAARHLDVHT